MAYVYLLRSSQDGRLYLGWTTDLRRRLCEHDRGETPSTRGHGPFELLYSEAYRHREEAIAREQTLKKRPHTLTQLKRRLYRTLPMASSRPQEVVG